MLNQELIIFRRSKA